MDWTVIGTGVGIISFVYVMLRDFRKDMDERFDKFDKKSEESNMRWIETNKKMDEKFEKVNMRMDGVYHILLKRIGEE